MRVVDAEGQFVGFVRRIVDQDLVIGRPMAGDIQVPMAACQMSSERVKLNIPGNEIAKMGHAEPEHVGLTGYGRGTA